MQQDMIKLSQLLSQLTTDELYSRLKLYENFKFNHFKDVLAYEMINRELDHREFFKQSA